MPGRMTPYDDEYRSCERTVAELRIYADDLDPVAVNLQLGLEPSSSQKKGETSTNALGRTRAAKLGGWFLSTEDHVTSKDLRRHLDWLLEKLAPKARELRQLQETPGIRMAVFCSWWSANGSGGPTLWPEQMRALADFNLECAFDISFFGEPER